MKDRILILCEPAALEQTHAALAQAGLPEIGFGQIPGLDDGEDPFATLPVPKLFWTSWQDDAPLLQRVSDVLSEVQGVVVLPGIVFGLEDPATAKTDGKTDPQPGEKLAAEAAIEVADRRLKTGVADAVAADDP